MTQQQFRETLSRNIYIHPSPYPKAESPCVYVCCDVTSKTTCTGVNTGPPNTLCRAPRVSLIKAINPVHMFQKSAWRIAHLWRSLSTRYRKRLGSKSSPLCQSLHWQRNFRSAATIEVQNVQLPVSGPAGSDLRGGAKQRPAQAQAPTAAGGKREQNKINKIRGLGV